MKAFLLTKKDDKGFSATGRIDLISETACVVMADSAQKTAKKVGGEYDTIENKPIVRFSRNLFKPFEGYNEYNLAYYTNGPITLVIGQNEPAEYLYIWELPIFVPADYGEVIVAVDPKFADSRRSFVTSMIIEVLANPEKLEDKGNLLQFLGEVIRNKELTLSSGASSITVSDHDLAVNL